MGISQGKRKILDPKSVLGRDRLAPRRHEHQLEMSTPTLIKKKAGHTILLHTTHKLLHYLVIQYLFLNITHLKIPNYPISLKYLQKYHGELFTHSSPTFFLDPDPPLSPPWARERFSSRSLAPCSGLVYANEAMKDLE